MSYHKPEAKAIQELKDIAQRLRIHSITSTQASKSGHPTSCASIAEIMSVLFFNTMRLNLKFPRDPSSDRFVLSKGHAAPILYAAWAEAGLFPVEDLQNLRKIDSDLEGHPTPRLNFIDVGTGSLGQGVAVAAGMAYVGKNFDKADYRTYVVVGDGESAEGSIWESLHFAGHYKLDNLCVIFDVNRLGQSEPTSLQHNMEVYRKRLEAFGFNALVVDGHDVEELCKAFHEAENTKNQPTAIIAKTYKGKFFPNIEDLENWHGKPLGDKANEVIKHLQGLMVDSSARLPALAPQTPTKCKQAPTVDITNVKLNTPPAYKLGEEVATRLAYGTALAKLAKNNDRVIALDGDTKNSTFSDKIKKEFPERYIECFIAEQNLVGVAIGAACRDRTIAFASTFATFFTRAFDQIRMGAISQTNCNFVGSHCGVSIGEDGPSQMGLEDVALFRTVPGSTVFYPSDAVSCERAVELAANTKGVCFIRTSRPNTAVLYGNNEPFVVGKGKVVKQSANDQVLLIGAGITLYECLNAAAELEKAGINARVIDPFTVKPLDVDLIVENSGACGGRVVVVEDHYQQGGLGEAVLSALADKRDVVVKHLFVPTVPRSGPPTVLIDMFGISARHVVNAANAVLKFHPTSCASIAEIMSVLFFNTMRLNLKFPRDPSSDRFVLSKGHAAPILYAAWAEAGLFPVEDLQNLRKIDSDLEGHPTPRLNFIDVGTGSLGQGVAVAAGMAYVGKNFDKADYRTYVVVGDGESAEGSIWESLHFAGHYKLDNLCVIFDVNRLGQSEPTSLQHNMEVYRKRLEAFGFNALVVDGHDVEELCKAFHEAENTKNQPTAIIAKTYKGKFFPNIEDLENWHGKPLGDKANEVIKHLQGLMVDSSARLPALAPQTPTKCKQAPTVDITNVKLNTPPAYKLGEEVATRLAYGTALAKLAKNNDRVIALDGDTKNSTFSDKIKKEFPERYIECFIAEQNLVGVAIGAACRDRTIAFASTFATFFTRAFDQIRMGAISQTNCNFVGSHCGVSIGEDGPSQMGLEDVALFRTVPGSTVFYPSDAVSCERAVELAANTKGVCFIRTSRPNTAVLYGNNEPFVVGKGKVVKQSANDQVLLIGAGITLYECLNAAAELEKAGINARVIDPFTVKPLDVDLIVENSGACGGRVVVVEDHYQQGGLGEAVLSALADKRDVVVKHLFVPTVPRSGPPTVLIDMFGISARHVVNAANAVLKL